MGTMLNINRVHAKHHVHVSRAHASRLVRTFRNRPSIRDGGYLTKVLGFLGVQNLIRLMAMGHLEEKNGYLHRRKRTVHRYLVSTTAYSSNQSKDLTQGQTTHFGPILITRPNS